MGDAAFKFKNPTLRRVINEFIKAKHQHEDIEQKCSEFIDFLNTLPKETDIILMPLEEWEKLQFKDFHAAQLQLRNETNKELRFIWVITAFKAHTLFKAILELLDAENYYAAAVLIRTLIEIFCFCRYLLDNCKHLVDEMNQNTDNYDNYYQTHIKLEKFTRCGTEGTRLDAILKEAPDSIKNTSILTAINHVAKISEYSALADLYDIFSDFAHPNKLSHLLFSVPLEISDDEIKIVEEHHMSFIKGEVKYCYEIPAALKDFHATSFITVFFKAIKMSIALFNATVEAYRDIEVKLLHEKPAAFRFRIDNVLSRPEIDEFLKKYKKSSP